MNRLLIVVDFQEDFVTGSLSFPVAKKLESFIVNKIKLYKEAGYEVIFTLDIHDNDYLNSRQAQIVPIEHHIKYTEGFKLYGEVAKLFDGHSVYFKKDRFGSLELAEHLKGRKYDTVEIIGLVTNICVIVNAILVQVALPDSKIIIDASCTASNNGDLYEKSLDVMKGLGIEIINR